MFEAFKNKLGAGIRLLRNTPVLGPNPSGGPASSINFIMVCRAGYDYRVPNANATYRLGLCRGFAQIGVRYELVSVHKLARRLPELANPFVCLSGHDYMDLSCQARHLLKAIPHFIWVHPWFDDLARVYGQHNLPDPRLPDKIIARVLDSQARFVFSIAPASAHAFYETWARRGQRLESVPLACDSDRYYPTSDQTKFSDVEMAFVGGYRPYKDIQYQKYLRPYEDRLKVFGYDRWPYRGYGGQLQEDQERVLYQNARLCPALSEPHAEIMGDIVERAFKVMGSRGLALTDTVPFYRDMFSPQELLVPKSMSEYHELVHEVLANPEFNEGYRERGYRAVMERHTYACRARTILDLLEVPWLRSRPSDDVSR